MEVSAVPEHASCVAGKLADRGDHLLPCGASLDAFLAQVADRRPPRDPEHQRTCPHCRAALAELEQLWGPVHELADEPVKAPADLLATVMARIREISRNPWYAVVPSATGGTRIAARVVGAVARLAAQSVPQVDVAIGRGRTVPADDDRTALDAAAGVDVAVVGTHVIVDLDITVDYGAAIPEVARQVRAAVLRDLQQHTGLTTTEVNVTVVDVSLP
jgi:uncharacterized alkaline shock family protein YloU